MDRIIASEPLSYRLDRRRSASERPTVAISSMGGGNLGFSADALSESGVWYGWVEGEYTFYNDASGALGARDGKFGVMSFGLDYLANERLAVGLMAQVDRTSERISGFSDISGTGWMVGPYVSAEISPDLFFSARAAWGKSSNSASIDVLGDENIFSGDSDTERSLLRAQLYGKYELGKVTLLPTAEVIYMRERQDAYSVSDGVNTATIAGATAEIGRFSLSSGIEVPVSAGHGTAILFATPQLDWGFLSNGTSSIDDSLSGSVEVGIKTGPGQDWSGEFAVRYDGIGQRDFEAISLRSSLNFRF
jgi:hypothetical protein